MSAACPQLSILALVIAGIALPACAGPTSSAATAPRVEAASGPEATEASAPPQGVARSEPATLHWGPPSEADPILGGRRPWWADLEAGLYRRPVEPGGEQEPWYLAVGSSDHHHHSAEGLLTAKIAARLGLRQATNTARLETEPRMLDLFITPERRFFVLYGIPGEAPSGASSAVSVAPPAALAADGRHQVGRHIFERDRHLYLECDVEGPIANPDWGSNRISARLDQENKP